MTRYHPALVALHWVLAILILIGLFGGTFVLDPLPEDHPFKIEGLQGHMTVGIAILVLMLVRLFVRVRTTHPPEADIGNPLMNRLARYAHWAMYALIFAMLGSGIAMSVLGGLPPIVFGGSGEHLPNLDDLPPRAAHGFFATVLMLLIVGHIAAALYHQFVRKDGLLRRMWFGARR
jgi:cytochrome b561